MKKRMQLIFFLLLSISLLFPLITASSQYTELDDDPLNILGMTIELEDALRGKNEVNIAREYRNICQAYFDRCTACLEDGGRDTDAAKIKTQSSIVMEYLNNRLKKAEETEDYFNNVVFVIRAVIMDGADSVNENTPSGPDPVISSFLSMHQEQTKQNATDLVCGHTASLISDSGPVIAYSSPSQIYHVDAGLPSVVIGAVDNESSGDGNINILKPLGFVNGGLYDVTVRVASYIPAAGVTASMSSASTVVFRGSSNPSAYLDLPLGTYTFCYYWDLGTDADKDGYVDYAHRNTGSVTLSATSSDDMNLAQVVNLNPGEMGTPNGKCGNTRPLPSENSDGPALTPQELANQGTYTYEMNCVWDGISEWGEYWSGQWDPFVLTFDFVEGGFNLIDEDGGTYFYQKIDINAYNGKDGFYADGIVTFTDAGFNYSGDGLVCTALRR